MARLARDGGPKVRMKPWPQIGKRFGEEELKGLKEALDQHTLFYTHGRKTKHLCAKMGQMVKRRHVLACSSCTGAIHASLKACDVGPGNEVIISPITDAGALVGIIYEGAIPVFADIDPTLYSPTAWAWTDLPLQRRSRQRAFQVRTGISPRCTWTTDTCARTRLSTIRAGPSPKPGIPCATGKACAPWRRPCSIIDSCSRCTNGSRTRRSTTRLGRLRRWRAITASRSWPKAKRRGGRQSGVYRHSRSRPKDSRAAARRWSA